MARGEGAPAPPSSGTTGAVLHCLGQVYLRQGQPHRAAVLLMVAAREAPGSAPVLRALAAALIACGLGRPAVDALSGAEALDPEGAAHPMGRLLRARALLADGRRSEARLVFRGDGR